MLVLSVFFAACCWNKNTHEIINKTIAGKASIAVNPKQTLPIVPKFLQSS